MRQRDKAIISDLSKFRVMSRDDIIALHFSALRQPVTAANTVLKRLRRDGHIKAVMDRHQYLYMPADSQIKKDSAKIPHFLKIVEFYREVCSFEKPYLFEVEVKVGPKGTVEPDVFMIWKNSPFYVEIQRSIYSAKTFSAKVDRYEAFYHGGAWRDAAWQPKGGALFPNIWIIGEARYDVTGRPFRLFQSRNVTEFMEVAAR